MFSHMHCLKIFLKASTLCEKSPKNHSQSYSPCKQNESSTISKNLFYLLFTGVHWSTLKFINPICFVLDFCTKISLLFHSDLFTFQNSPRHCSCDLVLPFLLYKKSSLELFRLPFDFHSLGTRERKKKARREKSEEIYRGDSRCSQNVFQLCGEDGIFNANLDIFFGASVSASIFRFLAQRKCFLVNLRMRQSFFLLRNETFFMTSKLIAEFKNTISIWCGRNLVFRATWTYFCIK